MAGLLVGASLACRDAEPPTAPTAGPARPLVTALGTLTTISRTEPAYLKASTGNLYWTQTTIFDDVTPGSRATVYRVTKTGTPGTERALYSETTSGSSVVSFHGITYASVGGAWYGYFIACYSATGSCKIKRIPLAGGSAVTIATLPAKASGPLETDWKFLYWPDAGGLRRVPVSGGTITTLVSFAGGPGTRSISLTSTDVYYADGAAVRRVPKAGGAVSTVVTNAGANNVYAHEVNGTTTVYWTAANAAVRSRVVGSSSTSLKWAGGTGRVGTSVGFDGTRVLWTECEGSTPSFPSGCTVRRRVGDVVTTVASTGGHYYVAALQWDASAMYFALGPAFGLKKYVH